MKGVPPMLTLLEGWGFTVLTLSEDGQLAVRPVEPTGHPIAAYKTPPHEPCFRGETLKSVFGQVVEAMPHERLIEVSDEIQRMQEDLRRTIGALGDAQFEVIRARDRQRLAEAAAKT